MRAGIPRRIACFCMPIPSIPFIGTLYGHVAFSECSNAGKARHWPHVIYEISPHQVRSTHDWQVELRRTQNCSNRGECHGAPTMIYVHQVVYQCWACRAASEHNSMNIEPKCIRSFNQILQSFDNIVNTFCDQLQDTRLDCVIRHRLSIRVAFNGSLVGLLICFIKRY